MACLQHNRCGDLVWVLGALGTLSCMSSCLLMKCDGVCGWIGARTGICGMYDGCL